MDTNAFHPDHSPAPVTADAVARQTEVDRIYDAIDKADFRGDVGTAHLWTWYWEAL